MYELLVTLGVGVMLSGLSFGITQALNKDISIDRIFYDLLLSVVIGMISAIIIAVLWFSV